MATAQATQAPTRTHLTLKGSTAMVSEFFLFSLQSILYQRNIYPAEDFKPVKKYGLQMLQTIDEGLEDYLKRCMEQMEQWMARGEVRRLVVAIVDRETQETVERWQFDVEVLNKGVDEGAAGGVEGAKENLGPDAPASVKKTDAQVKNEIAAIIKQITASCTFLPVLEENCAFTILAYTNLDTPIPMEWTESDARLIEQGAAEQVKLRSFSTHVHRVDAMVAYRRGEDD